MQGFGCNEGKVESMQHVLLQKIDTYVGARPHRAVSSSVSQQGELLKGGHGHVNRVNSHPKGRPRYKTLNLNLLTYLSARTKRAKRVCHTR